MIESYSIFRRGTRSVSGLECVHEEGFIYLSGEYLPQSHGGMYPAARAELKQRGIPCGEKRAVLLKRADYDAYDYLICMDRRNLLDAKRILGGDPDKKIILLRSFTGEGNTNAEIADPWYTGDFVSCADQIAEGCEGLLKALGKEGVRAIAGGNVAC